MAHIIEENNSLNQGMNSYDKRDFFADLGTKKGKNNHTYQFQITEQHILLIMIIVHTPENCVSIFF